MVQKQNLYRMRVCNTITIFPHGLGGRSLKYLLDQYLVGVIYCCNSTCLLSKYIVFCVIASRVIEYSIEYRVEGNETDGSETVEGTRGSQVARPD
jgi:hypothetical protein